MTLPLTVTFEVSCSPELAFDLWTTRIDTWWPSDHTVSGSADALVVLEAGVGGRIFERSALGEEHQWGEVTAWDPPHHLSYSWHLRSDRADATTVSVDFLARDAGTIVRIEHEGWERLGARADQWRARNESGWRTLVPHFVEAATNERGVPS